MLILKYIKFWNMFTDNFQDGFYLHEDDTYFYTCYPLTYDWLKEINRLDLLSSVEAVSYEKQFFQYTEAFYHKPQLEDKDTWFYSFPKLEKYINKMNSISNFFEWFIHFEKQHGRLLPSIEETLSKTKRVIETELLNELVEYVLSERNVNDDPDRLRLLYLKNIKGKEHE